MQKSASADICLIFYDALRFISRYFSIIQQSALHTYYSALPLTPTKSLLYNKYYKDRMNNLCELDGVPEQWDASIASIPISHSTPRVAFSSDGSQIAAWTEQELKLWGATSGTPIRTFKGAKIVIVGDFSVVAVPNESTVALHYMETDAPSATFSHQTEVDRVALSYDSTRVAAGLKDGTVSLWDRSRGEVMGSLVGYGGGQL